MNKNVEEKIEEFLGRNLKKIGSFKKSDAVFHLPAPAYESPNCKVYVVPGQTEKKLTFWVLYRTTIRLSFLMIVYIPKTT